MHVFLVNDDGIGAIGLNLLIKEAALRGHKVTIVAPQTQQSAMSHRFTLRDPLYVKDWPTEEPNCKAYALAGSPTDCVRVGMLKLIDEPVDVLVSGINNGYNDGVAVQYSGTFSAAMEGAFFKIPSIATSIHHKAGEESIRYMAAFTMDLAEQLAEKKLPKNTILNINMPALSPQELKEPVYCPLNTGVFLDEYIPFDAPRAGKCFWLSRDEHAEPPDAGSDSDYLSKGHPTMTLVGAPVSYDTSCWKDLELRLR